MHSAKMKAMVQKAQLEIVTFDMHIRNEMNNINRILPCYVMSYLKQGHAEVRLEGTTYHAGPGSVTILPPNVSHDHYIRTPEESIFLWWHFTYLLGGCIDVLGFMDIPVLYELKDKVLFEAKFENYLKLSHNDSLASVIRMKAQALDIFADLIETMFDEHALWKTDVSDTFIDILSDILASERKDEVSLEILSAHYHMHPTYISNKFKQYFGVTPITLFNNVLVQKTKQLFSSGRYNQTEIAERLGFNDLASFSRFFHGQTGLAPSAYKSLHPEG